VTAAATWGDLGIHVKEGGRVEQRVACPKCAKSDRDDALGVNIESGVFGCFRCGWSGRAAIGETRPARHIERRVDPAEAEQKRKWLRHIWSATVALDDHRAWPVREYLSTRGLADILREPPKDLRAHANLTYFDDGRAIGTYPAMIALFTDAEDAGVTLHTTFLCADGSAKAPVRVPKKLQPVSVPGATLGGAIRLYAPRDGKLGIAEGIESALSLRVYQQIPVWSAYSAGNLKLVRLPPDLRELYVAPDIDDSGVGQSAAQALIDRVMSEATHPRVFLVKPPGEGPRDLNDSLRQVHT
jgi:hypothetical protein